MDRIQTLLEQPRTLPCGAILKNRLAKSAMSDSLGNGEANPTQAQIRLYQRWAQGGIGLSIIGEVQVDPRYPEKPGNLSLTKYSDKEALRQLTQRASITGAHIWPQLGHAGALSHAPISQAKGPSTLDVGTLHCEGMTIEEIENLPASYAKAASIAKEVGFTGVQIHAGHGFLLSQFLSPLFNLRDDKYGGSIENRCRIILAIIDAVRLAIGPHFPIGIKINASDLLEGGLTEDDALAHIRLLDKTSVDLIEISAGTYFPGAKSSSDNLSKGVYYKSFAKRAKNLTSIPLMVTGGVKSLSDACSLLQDKSADLVGLARAMVLNPDLANDWFAGTNQTLSFPRFDSPPAEGITAWYTMRINAIALDEEKDFSPTLTLALKQYLERDELKSIKWRTFFINPIKSN
ncbi:oxidoreductase, FAD/FMN-binding [Marinomonas sp. MED121]|uniref:NADH:flavin oxidoreductase/NADH oxidase family protein n=1 Tax=Marinomonas sp. MED121 TaxID=314277 RepID=UPI0000690A50|nr:NADH:flavin oxidoreductase/NADH oxidase family protein [Marinomonas sp. MED121]EAQ64024.1 oxidoreductase, FAD/FMN-binding [Marinomonas sp. MED121]